MNASQKLTLIQLTAFLKDKLFHQPTSNLRLAYFDHDIHEKYT